LTVRLIDGKLLFVDGKLATDAACCCGDPRCSGPCEDDEACGECCKCDLGTCVPRCTGNSYGQQNGFCDFADCCVDGCCEENPCGGRLIQVEVQYTQFKDTTGPLGNPPPCDELDPPVQGSLFATFDSCIQPDEVPVALCEITIRFESCSGSAAGVFADADVVGSICCGPGTLTIDDVITTPL
jgi:hypothetical protein